MFEQSWRFMLTFHSLASFTPLNVFFSVHFWSISLCLHNISSTQVWKLLEICHNLLIFASLARLFIYLFIYWCLRVCILMCFVNSKPMQQQSKNTWSFAWPSECQYLVGCCPCLYWSSLCVFQPRVVVFPPLVAQFLFAK